MWSLAPTSPDVVIFDEAAQALEPCCWIPILRAPKVILAGDPFQLPPTVLSPAAEKQGLGVTLFERLFQKHKVSPHRVALACAPAAHPPLQERVCHMLEVQYRMHRLICQWSSAAFYEGRLGSDPSVAEHLLCDLPGVEPTDETSIGPAVGRKSSSNNTVRPTGGPRQRISVCRHCGAAI